MAERDDSGRVNRDEETTDGQNGERSPDQSGESQHEHSPDQSGESQRQRSRRSGTDTTDRRPRDVRAAGKQPRYGSTTQFSDFLERNDTTTELKAGVGLFAAVGLGFGLVSLLVQGLNVGVLFTGTGAAVTVAPVLAVLTARRQATRLSEIRGDLVYGTTVSTSAGGAVAMLVFVWLFEVIAATPGNLTELLLFWVVVAIATAAVGFLSLVATRET